MATHSSVLAWRIPGTGEPAALPSLGSHRVGHDWSDLAAATCFSINGMELIVTPTYETVLWLNEIILIQHFGQKCILNNIAIGLWYHAADGIVIDMTSRQNQTSCLQVDGRLWHVNPRKEMSTIWKTERRRRYSAYVDLNLFVLYQKGEIFFLAKEGGWKERDGCRMLCKQFSSVAQLCLILCNPMDCSTPGFPVHHQLPKLAQTHDHWVGDTIQPTHPLTSPSPPTFNLSHHQGLFQWVSSLHQVAKVLEFQLHHQSFQWIFRVDFL